MHRLFELAILGLLAVATTARSPSKSQHRVLSSVRGGDAPPKPDLPLPEVPAAVPVSSPATAPVDFSAHANHVAAAHANHMAAENAVVEGHKEAPLLPPAPAEATLPVPATPVQGTPAPTKSLSEVMGVAWRRALGGGIPGAIAGAVQVILLMWLRTTTNYQYRYGATTRQAMSILYKQGGLGRFYDGVGFALLQGPLSRFGSTAANEGVLALLKNLQLTKSLPLPVTTAIASLAAGAWRIVLMPIDTCKVILQVEGNEGFKYLMRRVKQGEVSVLYQGAAATCVATIVGHWPWFVVYNWLNGRLEVPKGEDRGLARLMRSAFIGFAASVVSDSASNCVRVLKITKQASASMASVSYMQALRTVLAADGWRGLMGRGLMTRIIGNGIQSMLFTVIWRYLKDHRTFTAKDSSDDDSRTVKAPLRVQTKVNGGSSHAVSGSA